MDKEQARFILHSFRPDGADHCDRDFADALAVAVADRELGEWLAAERAFDSAFAAALATVTIPENLREDIVACLAAQRDDFPAAQDAADAVMIGALASIQPPARLRGEILAAMERSAGMAFPRKSLWRRVALPMAAAAGVALAFYLTLPHGRPAPLAAAPEPVPLEVVQAGFIRAFESPLFTLDETREDHVAIIEHLKSRKLPCPGCLPPGLANVQGIGCRELVIDGKRGSLICYDERENGVVHMVIFRREDVCGEVPCRMRPSFTQQGSWAVARWADEQNVFILIGATDIGRLASLF